jgi:hypothetical protein
VSDFWVVSWILSLRLSQKRIWRVIIPQAGLFTEITHQQPQPQFCPDPNKVSEQLVLQGSVRSFSKK